MGWALMLGFAGLAIVALWRLGRLSASGLQFAAAALLLAVAGYALQGSPAQPGSPSAAAEVAAQDNGTVPSDLRRSFSSSMNKEGERLDLADALMKIGQTRTAVSILREGTHRSAQNADMWVGLGNALVVHGGGQMNPAAQYAFERAAQIAPNHPGPPFFLGFALVQSGKMDEAGEIWRGLLARAPAGAPWKADMEARLAEIGQMPGTK